MRASCREAMSDLQTLHLHFRHFFVEYQLRCSREAGAQLKRLQGHRTLGGDPVCGKEKTGTGSNNEAGWRERNPGSFLGFEAG